MPILYLFQIFSMQDQYLRNIGFILDIFLKMKTHYFKHIGLKLAMQWRNISSQYWQDINNRILGHCFMPQLVNKTEHLI